MVSTDSTRSLVDWAFVPLHVKYLSAHPDIIQALKLVLVKHSDVHDELKDGAAEGRVGRICPMNHTWLCSSQSVTVCSSATRHGD